MNHTKGASNSIIAIIIAIIVIIGLGVLFSRSSKRTNNSTNNSSGQSSVSMPVDDPGSPEDTNSQKDPSDVLSSSNNPTDSQQSQRSQVTIKSFAFNPQNITVKTGTTVVWTNQDSAEHSIVSNSFKSQPLPTGGSFEFTFNSPGTYSYSCGIHPSMTGKVIVQ